MDPNSNNANNDFLLADMRKLEWRGWEANNTKHETYYSPMVFSGFDEHQKAIQSEAWDRIDLYIRPSLKKGARPKRLGSIEDLQSFVVEDTAQSPEKVGGKKNRRQSKAERSYSTIRINLGNHLYNSDKVKLQAMHFNSRGGIANVAKSLTKMKSISSITGAPGSSHGKGIKGVSSEQLVLTGPADISEGDTVLVRVLCCACHLLEDFSFLILRLSIFKPLANHRACLLYILCLLTPCTLNPRPHTLHPAPCTLHPTTYLPGFPFQQEVVGYIPIISGPNHR